MRSSLRRRKPWIVVLIIIIAAIMVLPLYDVINVVGQMGEQREEQSFSMEDYLNDLKERIVQLESFIDENEPTPAILKELSSLYMKKAVELEPGNAEGYLALYELYSQVGDFEKAMEAASTGEALVIERLEEDPGDNENRLLYSRFLSGYHYDFDAALEQLTIIIDSETEESPLYNNAKMELERLLEQKEAQEEAAMELELGEEDFGFNDEDFDAITENDTEE